MSIGILTPIMLPFQGGHKGLSGRWAPLDQIERRGGGVHTLTHPANKIKSTPPVIGTGYSVSGLTFRVTRCLISS